MRFSFLAVLTTLFCTALTAHADIAWERSYETARTISRATGKPLFINFYTDWCGVCKSVDREVFPDPKVQQMARNFVMLRLNAEREGASQARYFQVRGYPTLLFLSAQGQPIYKMAGGPSAPGFTQLMQQVLQSVSASKSGSPNASPLASDAKAIAFRQQMMLRRAKTSNNYGGAFLLDENGVTALDVPAKKTKTKAKPKTRTAKKPRKSPGY